MTDHVIRWGETLSKIAKQHGTTVKALQEANNIKNANKIVAGKTLIIPDGKGTTVERTEPSPQDPEIQKARAAANQEAVRAMEEAKKASQKTMPNKTTRKEWSQDNAVSETADLIREEMRRNKFRDGDKRYNDVAYWAEKIDRMSKEYGFPKEVLVSQIRRECGYKKNIKSRDQYGAMQIRHTAVRAMFPKAPGNWSDKYKELDEKLYNDILYKKDPQTGEFLKDDKGNMIPKYNSWSELLKDCKNDEISMKVGILYDKMQYVEFIASKRYGRNSRYKHLSHVIEELKSQTQIDPKENETNLKGMLTRFNMGNPSPSVINSYGRDIGRDSLQRMNFNFAEPIIRRT